MVTFTTSRMVWSSKYNQPSATAKAQEDIVRDGQFWGSMLHMTHLGDAQFISGAAPERRPDQGTLWPW